MIIKVLICEEKKFSADNKTLYKITGVLQGNEVEGGKAFVSVYQQKPLTEGEYNVKVTSSNDYKARIVIGEPVAKKL